MSKAYGPWAVITGASDGIGRAIARRAAAEGLNLVLAARNETALSQLAEELGRSDNIETRFVTVDLSGAEGPGTLIDAVADLAGGIVLFGSLLGWQGVPGHANYAATKAYVQALGEGLHAELKPYGVDVLCVAPGPVHSGFAARAGMTLAAATTPEVVADGAWAALGRRSTVVPGLQAKALTSSVKTLPRPVRSMILGRVMAAICT